MSRTLRSSFLGALALARSPSRTSAQVPRSSSRSARADRLCRLCSSARPPRRLPRALRRALLSNASDRSASRSRPRPRTSPSARRPRSRPSAPPRSSSPRASFHPRSAPRPSCRRLSPRRRPAIRDCASSPSPRVPIRRSRPWFDGAKAARGFLELDGLTLKRGTWRRGEAKLERLGQGEFGFVDVHPTVPGAVIKTVVHSGSEAQLVLERESVAGYRRRRKRPRAKTLAAADAGPRHFGRADSRRLFR